MSVGEIAVVKSRVGALIRATAGNFLEQFDFFLFGFYAVPISKAFFPAGDDIAALMFTFAIFWIGALMRPVGALILGAYTDRAGRRQGLIITLSIMATGTLVLALCPTYASIGIAAPLIVLFGRLAQGFSAGVELGAVSVYLFEVSLPERRGFFTSFQSASQQVSIFVAALIGYAVNGALSPQRIDAGGWRIPFAIGCLIVPFIFIVRRSLEESPQFLWQRLRPSPKQTTAELLKNWRVVFIGVLLVAMTTVTFYFTTVYTPTFGKTALALSDSNSLLVTLCVAAANFLWLPVGGAISDRVGRGPVLVAVSLLGVITAYPALHFLVAHPGFGMMLAVELWFSMQFGLYNGAMVAALCEIVPARIRTTCFSVSFSIAVALFGSFTPLLSTWLISVTHDRASPGYWLMAAGVAGLIASVISYRTLNAIRRGTAAASMHAPPRGGG
jgi:MHS family citrate/tricarballylate:H+ symporter-like MFS transporter